MKILYFLGMLLMLVSNVKASPTVGIVETFSTIVLFVLFFIFMCAGLGYFARSKNYVESSKPASQTMYT